MLNLLPGKKSMKGILLGIVLSLILIFSVTFSYINSIVHAGTFQSASVTISDSRASGGGYGTSVTYDFAMTASINTAIKQVDITFCTTPTGTCTAPPGLDVGSSPVLASDNISGTGRTTTNPTDNNTIRVVITTPSVQSPLAITMQFTGITNPTDNNSSFYARTVSYSDTGTTEIDSSEMGIAVLDTTSIAVTAQVGSTFTFSVAAANTGSVNGESITVTDSTDTTIPFGVLVRATPKVAAHDISVVTNANTGYTVTVRSDADPPLSEGSNNIDKFSSTNATPGTWSAPAGTTKNVNTGFFGYTTNDEVLGTGTVDRFPTPGIKWAGPDPTPYEVAYSAVAVVTPEVTRLGWKAEVNGYQPPGNYSGYIVLVATPLY